MKCHLWLALGLVAAASCSRCGRGRTDDFATVRATDLRTSILTVLPEFRGIWDLKGEATVSRELRWSLPPTSDLVALLTPSMVSPGFTPLTGGGNKVGTRPPFELRAGRISPNAVELSVALPLGPDDPGKLLSTPSPMGTQHLATYLPRPQGYPRTAERFHLWLSYQTRPDRADFLIQQLSRQLVRGGWKSDEVSARFDENDGGTPLPKSYGATFRQDSTHSAVHVQREAGAVRVDLKEDLLEP